MRIIKDQYYKVHIYETRETIVRFTKWVDAIKYAKGRGYYGSDASVYLKELNIIIFDSLEEQKLYEIEKQKENDENNKKRLEEENQIWNQIPGTRS